MNNILEINADEEIKRITGFLGETFAKQKIHNTVIGLSGGVDSALSFQLLKHILKPQHIFIAHLFYNEPIFEHIGPMLEKAQIPEENITLLSIKEPVDALANLMNVEGDDEKIRRGNIAARMRMISLYDLSKKYSALVCGTENKTENLLGYFTRFGDQASDIEPIEHLYKTQVYQLAKHLGVPQGILDQQPTAGLWVGQTDEGEFGFTYKEADHVLYYAYEQGLPTDVIISMGYKNAERILAWREKNLFKHETPYVINK